MPSSISSTETVHYKWTGYALSGMTRKEAEADSAIMQDFANKNPDQIIPLGGRNRRRECLRRRAMRRSLSWRAKVDRGSECGVDGFTSNSSHTRVTKMRVPRPRDTHDPYFTLSDPVPISV